VTRARVTTLGGLSFWATRFVGAAKTPAGASASVKTLKAMVWTKRFKFCTPGNDNRGVGRPLQDLST
jgi:hypothetical protein